MKYALSSREMKSIDEFTIRDLQIPAMVLMERAAKEVADHMISRIRKTDRVLAVCGPGNNGGDGVAAGRILYLQGYHVAILLVGDENKASIEMKAQLEIARNLGIPFENRNKLNEYNIIIDAIFGIGLSRPVTGAFEEIINLINAGEHRIFSVDIPSGICADSGKVLNTAVKADATITFGYQKRGLIFYPGTEYAGNVTVADIGFPDAALQQVRPEAFFYEREDLKRLPVRKNYSHKGTFGKVLVIAGSKGMCGAAYLSAKAAYRTGAGLVKVLTSKENRIILQTSLPEALFAAYDEISPDRDEWEQMLQVELTWADVIVIGPGLGLSHTSQRLLNRVLDMVKVPLIIDADGINLLAAYLNHFDTVAGNAANESDEPENGPEERLKSLTMRLKTSVVLTPHLKELSGLTKIPVTDIANNLIDTARQCSYNNNLIYAIKDARSIVTQHGRSYINISGNNGMATGGSGDVLTGVVAALVAQGMEPFDATCLAVYIHGLAGDEAASRKGTYSMMAGDIVDSIEKVLQSI